MNSKIRLEQVVFIPNELDQGVLYVSDRYNVAVHLCACGCENKVTTPLGPAEWSFNNDDSGPTLYPSIGNWQIPCKSHYWIKDGEILWSYAWTEEQIERGRKNDQEKLEQYFKQRELPEIRPQEKEARKSFWVRIKDWILQLFK
ncbi:DUF6527 family protein [Sphingobacterium cellulitidis]|uniref:DUF6527 family protein n=1 Tax=Sphingobacterium cellulitidis TaxID=1768011 RepID=UPI00370D3B61